MSKFVDGMPDKLAFYVRASKPKDASDALTLAKTGEAYKYRESKSTVAAARNISSSQSEISSLKHQMNQLTDLMNDMKTQKQTTIIDLYKGKTLAMFDEITSEHSLLPFNDTSDHCVQNVNLIIDTNGVNSITIPNKSDSVKLDSTVQSDNDNTFDSAITDFIANFLFEKFSLDKVQLTDLHKFLYNNKDIFMTKSDPSLGFTDLVKHKILLKPDAKPKYQKPYRLSPDKKDVLGHHLDNLLEQGIISPVFPDEDLPITSPIVLVTKRVHGTKHGPPYDKDSSLSQFRFCCDFRYLNSQCQIFSYNIPDLQDLTESFSQRKPNFITSIDMSSGFFQMKIDPSSSKYTAFNTCFGTYKFNRLPIGLSSEPNSFQLLMDKVLSGLTFRSCLCYLDDVLICSETFQEHINDLTDVFNRFRSVGLKLNPKKCQFAEQSCIFLGHHISAKGIKPPPDRVQALQTYPSPRNFKELRRALEETDLDAGYTADTEDEYISPKFSENHCISTAFTLPTYSPIEQTEDEAKHREFELFDSPCEDITALLKPMLRPKCNKISDNAQDVANVEIKYVTEDQCFVLNNMDNTSILQPFEMTDSPCLMNESTRNCDTQDNVLHEFDPLKDKTQHEQFNDEIDCNSALNLHECEWLKFTNVSNLNDISVNAVQKILLGEKSDHELTNESQKDTDILTEDDRSNENKPVPIVSSDDELVKRSIELFKQSDFSPESVKELQRNDENLQQIIDYLENGVLPNLQRDARRLILRCADYLLMNNLLFHNRNA
ncbi:unnamed protein product [Mytilus coruscus]|uniref:Reverse transcriptase domain-containing protein n=1 Tax=Mytilus coruscus TaxID=42192 RepID=A0A6J8BLU1_MYTCO|nr:unnamed protein product [Mytilus coruscus]